MCAHFRARNTAQIGRWRSPNGSESDVVLGGTRRLARVDSDADTNPPPGKRLLRLERSGSRAERGGERDEQCIPLRIHLDARVRSEHGAQEPAVLGERAAYASPSSLSSRVEPSTSVKSSVTRPAGRSGTSR